MKERSIEIEEESMSTEKKSMKFCFWTALIVMALTTTVHSQENRLKGIKFNGFLSVVGGRTLGKDDTYLANAGADLEGSMYDDSFSFSPDTTFAIQAYTDLGEDLSATAQLLGHAANDFNLDLEWAYLRYNPTEEISIYGGRKRAPFYLYSDTLDLGYGYHWIRPPNEMYWLSVTSYDGLSITYSDMIGSVYTNFEAFYGSTKSKETRSMMASPGVEIDAELENFGGAFLTLGQDWLQARMGMAWARVDIIAQLPLSLGGPTTMSEGNDITYYSGALKLEKSKFFVISEYSETRIEKDYNDVRAWYVSGGLRIGKWTPHVTLAEFHELATRSNAEERATTTVGVRYDFHDNACYKLEFSKTQDRGDTPGTSYYGDAALVSFGVDITF